MFVLFARVLLNFECDPKRIVVGWEGEKTGTVLSVVVVRIFHLCVCVCVRETGDVSASNISAQQHTLCMTLGSVHC